jgi:alpha-tubulin suppressor-like RCC1 family protein
MKVIDKANSGYRIAGTDIANTASAGASAGFVSKDYLISAYPSLAGQLTTAGLWAWGRGAEGELGDNAATNRSSPVQTASKGYDWTDVSSGATDHAVAIRDGQLWAWGVNRQGKLGDNTTATKSSPVQTVAGGTNWKQADAGYDHSAGVKTDGTLWTWGANDFGQLGTNNITHRSSPVQTVAAGTTWKQVSTGAFHSAAIKNDGTLWNWGWNNKGQLADGTTSNRSSPVQTAAGGTNWRLVSCGIYHAAAIKNDGSLWTWGNNDFGQIGDGTTTDRSSPVQTIAGGSNWKLVACGDYFTVAIKEDGTLWSWGVNTHGQIGSNNTTSYSSPVQTVAGGTDWKLVDAGSYHTTAIKTNGSMWAWGRGNLGQHGNGASSNRSSPIQISSDTNWRRVACGSTSTYGIRDDSDFPL